MKKKLLSTLLCTCLILSGTVPAFAYQVYSWGEIGPDNYTVEYMLKNREALNAKKIYEYEHASFSEGLLRIFQGTEEGTTDNFIDQNGNLIDLNRGRFSFMSTFSGGLSSVGGHIEGKGEISGFVNKKGELVLDTSKYGSFHYYKVMTSRFVNGKALLSNFGWVDLRKLESKDPTEMISKNAEFVVIDTTGKVLETIKGPDKLMAHPLFKTSITSYDGVPLGVLMDPMAYAGTSGGDSAVVPSEPIPQPSKEYRRPDLPDYVDAETYFQSKGKVTNIFLGDLDFGTFTLTITNNTAYRDSGVIAVAAANVNRSTGNNSSGVFFVPYVLAPHSSGEYQIAHRDIIHQNMFDDNSRWTGLKAEALTGQVAARVIHFKDDDDLWSFYNIVPYEQNWEPRNLVSDFQPLCNGAEGQAFLKQLRIDRPAVASGDHSFCTPK